MSLAGSDTQSNGPYSLLEWTGFFESKRQVTIPKNLDSSEITFTLYEINGSDKVKDKENLPVILLHHGAGHCALSFAATARELGKLVGDRARILSYDARGHGETTSKDQLNLHVERLATDVRNVLWTLFGRRHLKEEEEHDQEPFLPTTVHESTMPKVFLVGHSMGGAVVTEVVHRGLVPNVVGMAVLDILEVVKPMAFVAIRSWCDNRPNPCKVVEDAIRWAMDADIVRNLESARVSFPGMVVRASEAPDSHYLWRTDLLKSEQYWSTFFDGLNQKFLGTAGTAGTAGIHRPFPPSPSLRKLLILSGQSFGVMDEELKAALEDKRFQLSVFEAAGHAVQEDDPTRMGQELFAFAASDLGLSS